MDDNLNLVAIVAIVLVWDHPTKTSGKGPGRFPIQIEVQGSPIPNQMLEDLPLRLVCLVTDHRAQGHMHLKNRNHS